MSEAAERRYVRGNSTRGEKELVRDVRIEQLRDRAPEDIALEAELRVQRPRFRADCVDGERPCPWVSCRHHLYLEANESSSLTFNFPLHEPEQLEESCALDVADRGGLKLEEVGELINVTRERVRQIEAQALRKVGLRKTLLGGNE